MPRGRPRKLDPGVSLHVRIPQSLYTRLEEHLPRNVKGKIPDGAKGDVVAIALREYLDSQEATPSLDDLLELTDG